MHSQDIHADILANTHKTKCIILFYLMPSRMGKGHVLDV